MGIGAASASAATPPRPPSVVTGGASQVAYATATTSGWVNPNGSATSYYVQYGVTRAYGGQSAIADAGSGTATVKLSVGLSGLQPLTLYHYRLVAVNAAGAASGADHTFLTTKVPLSLQILSSPNPVPFGGTATIQGTLSGTGNAGRAVVLQENPFPYTAGFQNVGNPELTTATGSFSFPMLGLTASGQFRVSTTTNPPVVSPVASEQVAVLVSSHVRRAGRAHHARIYGTVTPAENGAQIGIMRIVAGRNVLVAGTVLRAHGSSSSSFSRILPVHRGVYRVFVLVNGAQISAYGQPLLIR